MCLVPDKADDSPEGGKREQAQDLRTAGGLPPGGQ